jgi:hypothetical protein
MVASSSPNDRASQRVTVGSGTPIHATLLGPLRSVGATVRDVSLTGVSLALNQEEPSIVAGETVAVDVGDARVVGTVRHVDSDRPW